MLEAEKLGIEVRVKEGGDELVNEVKRIGYMKDRDSPLQLKVGDTVFLYISSSNA